MATLRDRSSSRFAATGRQPSAQPNNTPSGFPYRIPMPDGETENHQFHPVLRHNGGPEQEAELLRSYLKPPENKSLSDVEGFHRSCSMGVLGDRDDWSTSRSSLASSSSDRLRSGSSASCSSSSSHPQHRHSAPQRGSGSLSGSSSGAAAGGSPRGKKVPFQMFPFLSPARDKSQDVKSSRQSPTTYPFSSSSILGSPPPSTTTTALADIAMVRCGPHSYSSDELLAEDEGPPVYSDVIQNPNFYKNVTRPKQRTSSGKM